MTRIERLKLVTEYKRIRGVVEGGGVGRVERMRSMVRLKEIRETLGAGAEAEPAPNVADIEFIQSIVDGQADLLAPGIIERFKDAADRLSVGMADLVRDAKTAAIAWFRREYQIRSA